MKNKIMLITYADSFGKDLKELKWVVDRYFKREINGIHAVAYTHLDVYKRQLYGDGRGGYVEPAHQRNFQKH